MNQKQTIENTSRLTKLLRKISTDFSTQESRRNLELAERRYENLKTFTGRLKNLENKERLIKHCQKVYDLGDFLFLYSRLLSVLAGLLFTLITLIHGNDFFISLLEQSIQFDLSVKRDSVLGGLSAEALAKINDYITIGFLVLFILVARIFIVHSSAARESLNYQLHLYKTNFFALAILLLSFAVSFALGFYGRSDYSSTATLFWIYLLVFLFAFILFYQIIYFLLSKALQKRFIYSYSIESIFRTLYLLERNSIEDVQFRATLCKRIDRLANYFEHEVTSILAARDAYSSYIIEIEMGKIANGFRELKLWLYTPMSETKSSLLNRFSDSLNLLLEGDWHSLPKVATYELSNNTNHITKRQIRNRQLKRYANLLFRVLLPFLLIGIIQLTPFRIASKDVLDYAIVGASVFAALLLIIELDPNLIEKLNLLEQVKKLIVGDK